MPRTPTQQEADPLIHVVLDISVGDYDGEGDEAGLFFLSPARIATRDERDDDEEWDDECDCGWEDCDSCNPDRRPMNVVTDKGRQKSHGPRYTWPSNVGARSVRIIRNDREKAEVATDVYKWNGKGNVDTFLVRQLCRPKRVHQSVLEKFTSRNTTRRR